GRAAAKSRTRASAASRDGASDRSRPVSARPVAVVWTCASVNAGVTSAPSRSITSSTPSAKASAAPSAPTHATWPRSTTIAVANGSAGLWTSPRRSRTVRLGTVRSLMPHSLAPRTSGPAARSGSPERRGARGEARRSDARGARFVGRGEDDRRAGRDAGQRADAGQQLLQLVRCGHAHLEDVVLVARDAVARLDLGDLGEAVGDV